MRVWDCTSADVEWLAALGDARYLGMEEGYEPKAARNWLRQIIGHQDVLAVRGEASAAVAFIIRPSWAPGTRYCDLGMICAAPDNASVWEPLALLRALHARSKAAGCSRFYIHSSFANIGPLAKRLGGRALPASYVLEG